MRGLLTEHLHRIWQHKGLASTALLPLSWAVRAMVSLKRRRRHPPRASGTPPVIVVGNLYVGGTGKTPVVIALVRGLRDLGWTPGVISRGYGVRIGKMPRLGRGSLSPDEFGDEPALIAQSTGAPVAVHPHRVLALAALRARWPEVDVVISDDGLQHHELARDVEFVVQDGRGLGNGRLIPAGPLREPPDRLHSIDYLVTNLSWGEKEPVHAGGSAMRIIMRLAPGSLRHVRTGRELSWSDWKADQTGKTVTAVAGIGQPERFFRMLRAMGLRLHGTLALPDHHGYAHASPFAAITTDLVLVTGKDAVKLRGTEDDRLWEVGAEPVFTPGNWLEHVDRRLRMPTSGKL